MEQGRKNPVSSVMTKTLVCVDSYNEKVVDGRILNPYLEAPIPFCGIMEFLTIVDSILDHFSFPQRALDYRKFTKTREVPSDEEQKEVVKHMDEIIFETERGKKATFIIQVQFRQNATWQGSISWAEEKKSQKFRSTLEMIKLMDDALSYMDPDDDTVTTWETAEE